MGEVRFGVYLHPELVEVAQRLGEGVIYKGIVKAIKLCADNLFELPKTPRKRQYLVDSTLCVRETARMLGNGNLSEGVRVALQEARDLGYHDRKSLLEVGDRQALARGVARCRVCKHWTPRGKDGFDGRCVEIWRGVTRRTDDGGLILNAQMPGEYHTAADFGCLKFVYGGEKKHPH